MSTFLNLGVSLEAMREAGDAKRIAKKALITSRHQQSAIKMNSENVLSLTKDVRQMNKNQMTQRLRTGHYEQLKSKLEDYTRIIDQSSYAAQHLLKGSVLPMLLNHDGLDQTLEEIKSEVNELGYTTLPHLEIRDLFDMPFESGTINGSIYVNIHIPVYDEDSLMETFRFKSIPWRHFVNGSAIDAEIELENDVIGVTKNGDYQILSHRDLEKCPKHRDFMLCGTHRQFIRKQHKTCLSSLYHHKTSDIIENCPMVFKKPRSSIVQIDQQHFLVMTNGSSQQFQSRCNGDKMDKLSYQDGVFELFLPDGCRFDMEHLSIRKMPLHIHPKSFFVREFNSSVMINHLHEAMDMLNGGLEEVSSMDAKLSMLEEKEKMHPALMDDNEYNDFLAEESRTPGLILDIFIIMALVFMVIVVGNFAHNKCKNSGSTTSTKESCVSGFIGIVIAFITKCCITMPEGEVPADNDRHDAENIEMRDLAIYNGPRQRQPIYEPAPRLSAQRLRGCYLKAGLDPENPERMFVVTTGGDPPPYPAPIERTPGADI